MKMRSIKGLSTGAFLWIISVLSSSYAVAQEEEMASEGMSVFRMVIEHSGWPGFVIIAMSVVAIFMAMRFFFLLRRSEMMPESFISQIEDDIDNQQVGSALKKCVGNDSKIARILEDGLQELRAGHEEMLAAAEDSAEAESIRMQQQVGWLSIIGAIAPMIGLMGTVLGMLGAFGVIASAETQPPPRLLAEQIQLALVTTAEGLIVGVPVLVVYAALRNKATAVFLDMGLVVSDLIDRFKYVEITPDMVEDMNQALESEGEELEDETEQQEAAGELEETESEELEDLEGEEELKDDDEEK